MQESYHLLNASLEVLCARAAGLRVEDAMVPAVESIDVNASLGEAIHVAVREHVQSLVATDGGTVVGILRTSDVFEEVADLIRQ
jgi:predicted transcriptional regulator